MEKSKATLEKKTLKPKKVSVSKKENKKSLSQEKKIPSSVSSKTKAPANDPHVDQKSSSHFDFLRSLKLLENALLRSFVEISKIMTYEQKREIEAFKKEIFYSLDYHRHAVNLHTKNLEDTMKTSQTKK